MIICEGPDGSGKTTLVKMLSDTFDLNIEPRVVDKDTNPLRPLKDWVVEDLQTWPRPALYDRHRLISEPIYAPIIRGQLADGFEDLAWFTSALRYFYGAKPLIIYCLPHIDTVLSNLADDPDNTAIVRNARDIYWLYHCQAVRDIAYSNKVLIWDYQTMSYDRFLGSLYITIQGARKYYERFYVSRPSENAVNSSNRKDAGW